MDALNFLKASEEMQTNHILLVGNKYRLSKREQMELTSSEELELIKKIIKFKKHLRKSRF
jgi:hypothetical protein